MPVKRGKPPHAGPPGPGTRMKCIDDTGFDMTYPDIRVPVLNQTYTIRNIMSNPDSAGNDCYRFQEITNPIRKYHGIGDQECAFKASRFQKVK